MKSDQLERVLRAGARILEQADFLVVGSAAIIGSVDDALLLLEASRSDEADLASFDDPDGSKSMQIEGALGQGSQFHSTFGYYADGVDFATAMAPAGWQDRLVRFATEGSKPGRGWCLEPHDLAASKLAAGRQKDYEFVESLLRAGLIDLELLAQ